MIDPFSYSGMPKLDDFSNHLKTIGTSDWERLFSLLPEIEATRPEDFGRAINRDELNPQAIYPQWEQAEIVSKTKRAVVQLRLTPLFDWKKWTKGEVILRDKSFDYSRLDAVTLCKLFSVMLRSGDRFYNSPGQVYWFGNGTMAKIIKALRAIIHHQTEKQGMHELAEFADHLKTIDETNWQKLFRLLPEIEATREFGWLKGGEKRDDGTISFPYWEWASIVKETVYALLVLNLMPVFAWMQWREGIALLDDRDADYAVLDVVTLCKLFTVMVRGDKFSDGHLVSCFKNGSMAKLIRALQQKVLNDVPKQ